jgi:NAD(P)H-dependent FMN reductase
MYVLMLVGSLRADSWTAKLADSAGGLMPGHVRSEVYADLGALPHYSQDLDTDRPPSAVVDFRAAVESADALVVATPEYNGAMPGVLKNAIDWASRPRGASAIGDKPVAVISVSPSPRGAQWAREDAVKVLGVAGAVPLEQSIGVASVHDVVVDGQIADRDVEEALSGLMHSLVAVEHQAA